MDTTLPSGGENLAVFLGADHRGFTLKEEIKKLLYEKNVAYQDVGAPRYELADDYPDFSQAVAREVLKDPESRRGILICGSGVGMCVAANRFKRVRAALATTPEIARAARNDDAVNVLCLASDFTTPQLAREIVQVFLSTPFAAAERFKRRIEKVEQFE